MPFLSKSKNLSLFASTTKYFVVDQIELGPELGWPAGPLIVKSTQWRIAQRDHRAHIFVEISMSASRCGTQGFIMTNTLIFLFADNNKKKMYLANSANKRHVD